MHSPFSLGDLTPLQSSNQQFCGEDSSRLQSPAKSTSVGLWDVIPTTLGP